MSAITGIWDFRAIAGSASASSWDGTATRTIWQPAAVSSAICCNVAFTSAVSVVVIDCTETGAPPPTGTACGPLPTMIWREARRGASGAEATTGMPRLMLIKIIALLKLDRVEDVRGDEQHTETYEHEQEADAQWYEFLHIDRSGVGPPPQPREGRPHPLKDNDRQLPAVEREKRQQVEQPDEDVHRRDDQQEERCLLLPAHAAGAGHLAGGLGDADDARDPAAVLAPVRREQLGDLARQL